MEEEQIKKKIGKVVKSGFNQVKKYFILIDIGEKKPILPYFKKKDYQKYKEVMQSFEIGEKIEFEYNLEENEGKPIYWIKSLKKHIKEPVNTIKKETIEEIENQITLKEQLDISIKVIDLYYKLKNPDINKLETPNNLDSFSKQILEVKNQLFAGKK